MTNSPSLAARLPFPHTVRWLMPVVLVLFFLAILIWLPWQARQMERGERQEQLIADTLWVEQTIRFQMGRHEESTRAIGNDILAGTPPARVHERMLRLLKTGTELKRLMWLDPHARILASTEAAPPPLATLSAASRDAADRARRSHNPVYSQPGGDPLQAVGTPGAYMMDYHLPLYRGDVYVGSVVATYQLSSLLDEMVPWWFAQDNQISLLDRDDRILARRAAAGPGHGVYTHKRALDLPGVTVTLMTDSVKSEPKLLPNLLVGSVIVLSLALLWSLLALWGHISRRLAAEDALRMMLADEAARLRAGACGLPACARDSTVMHERCT